MSSLWVNDLLVSRRSAIKSLAGLSTGILMAGKAHTADSLDFVDPVPESIQRQLECGE